MTESGFYMCTPALPGKVFGIYYVAAEVLYVNFLEVMVYTQEAIQLNALSSTVLTGTTSSLPPSNAMQNIVVAALWRPKKGV